MTNLTDLRHELHSLADPETAAFLQRFFRTGPNEYGEGDRFLGIRVPRIRALVRPARSLPLEAVRELLHSPWHEERLLALLLLVDRFRRGDTRERATLHRIYLSNTRYINSWDLVDVSAEHLVGAHLNPDRIDLLRKLARSKSLWERRIAIIATFHWIRRGIMHPTLEIAALLVNDPHDLIHKATGWMLREVGKRDRAAEEEFLNLHATHMPRTMLRYAIERFPEELRRSYLRRT